MVDSNFCCRKRGFYRESYAKAIRYMKANLSAVSTYRNLLREYSDLLAMNVDEYTASFAQKNVSFIILLSYSLFHYLF